MRTTIDLPEKLLKEAARLSKEKTKTATIISALREYIRLKKLEKLAKSSGSVRFDPSYSWSSLRHAR
jgi:hypothetical protein